ncbi:MAG: NAD(P)-binding domain-containing protein, partial [Verrucomicrobiota bacterium]
MSEKIAFVGTGRMGANMARRLHEQGMKVVAVYDANAATARSLGEELGCAAPETLAAVTALADVVITVVSDDAAMDRIFAEEGDSLLAGAEGKLFINCATVSPRTHQVVEKRAGKVGAQSLEACMASSITQAREGTLYLMCGGGHSVFERARPILEKLSSSTRYVGGTGQ